MEITLDTLINLLGLILGGGCGAFFTWKWQRKKAQAEAKEKEAEAKEKEAEAKSAEVALAQKVQDTYQEMLEDKQKEIADNQRLIAELRADREHYRQVASDMRDRQDKTDDEVRDLKMTVARNARQLESMRPFQCYDMKCKKRQRVPASECELTDPTPAAAIQEPHEIDPINED